MTIGPLLSLVRKDLRLLFYDRRALLLTFAAPILVSSFIGWIFSGANASDNHGVGVEVVDLDHSPYSIALVKDLLADQNLHVTPATESKARSDVLTGKMAAAIILPPGLANDMANAVIGGIKPVIELPHDPSQGMALAMVHGVLVQHVLRTAVDQLTTGASPQARLHNWLNQLDSSPAGTTAGTIVRTTPAAPSTAPANRQAVINLLRAADIWLSLQPPNSKRSAPSPPPSASAK